MATFSRDPWFRIFPERLIADARLRRLCPETARGLYYEGRNVMHSYGQPYGHLALQVGIPMPVKKIAELLAMTESTVAAALVDIFEAGLWGRTEAGVLFDQDLVDTLAVSMRNRTTGAMGGNPHLKKSAAAPVKAPVKAPVNRVVNPPVNPPLNPPVNPLSLSLSSLSSEERDQRESEEARPLAHIPTLEEFVAAFMTTGIPRDYLEDKFAWFDGNNQWLDQSGCLKKYDVLVRAWWKKDREKWESGRLDEKPTEATRSAIEEQLRTETDPSTRRRLLAALNNPQAA